MSSKISPSHVMQQRIETGLHQALAIAESKTAPQNLQRALHHAVFPGGARIRPQLCLAVAAACGDDDQIYRLRPQVRLNFCIAHH